MVDQLETAPVSIRQKEKVVLNGSLMYNDTMENNHMNKNSKMCTSNLSLELVRLLLLKPGETFLNLGITGFGEYMR